MSRADRTARPHDPTTASHLGVSEQPTRGRVVLLVLTPAEPLTKVVQVAAREASRQAAPLLIAMLPPGPHVGAPCMAALDTALQLVRAAAPRQMVRVYTLSPQDVGAHLVADELVVASPATWSRLPDHVRAAHPEGPLLLLVEPEG